MCVPHGQTQPGSFSGERKEPGTRLVFERTPALLLRASNDGKVEWNTTAEYATAFLSFDWLKFLWRGIRSNTKLMKILVSLLVLKVQEYKLCIN